MSLNANATRWKKIVHKSLVQKFIVFQMQEWVLFLMQAESLAKSNFTSKKQTVLLAL